MPIVIMGCGSTGSSIALLLTRMGFTRYELFDDDVTEEHNIANQYYEQSDLKYYKVDALRKKMININPHINVIVHKERYDREETFGSILILCTDNMMSRQHNVDKNRKKNHIIVDVRIGALDAQSHVVTTRNAHGMKHYEKTLYSDEQAVEGPCTFKTVIHNVTFITSIAIQQLINKLQHNTNSSVYTTLGINPTLLYTEHKTTEERT